MSNEELALVLSNAIEQQQFETALELVRELRPIDIADLLAAIDPALAWRLLEKLEDRSTIFSYFDPDVQDELARAFPRASLARLVGEMPSDERADLYKRLDQGQR